MRAMENIQTCFFIRLIIFANFAGSTFTQEFQTQPTDVQVSVGEPAALYCVVRNQQEGQTLGWMRGQERITMDATLLVDLDHFTIRLDPLFGYNLAITATKATDGNRYACAVFQEGMDSPILKSIYAHIEVWQKPSLSSPNCSTPDSIYRYIEGSPVILVCTAEYLIPQVTLKWFYNGIQVDFGTIYIDNDQEHVYSHFSFPAAKHFHSAEFVCELTTDYDSNLRQSCTTGPIVIDYRPIVYVETVFAMAGIAVSVVCNATASPDPFIHTWQFMPEITQDQYTTDVTGRNLQILSPRTRMNGSTIQCNAYNNAGYGKGQAIFIVQGIDPPDEIPISIVTPVPEATKFNSLETNTVAIIFLIVGICSVVIVFFAVIPICFRPACREAVDANGRKIPQPDVYFEPKDRVLPPVPSEEQYALWRRSVAVQVSDTGGDLDSTYAEVMEEIEDKDLSIIYSRKSIYI